MFLITRRQFRRWSPVLIWVMVLHWCVGLNAAVADVLCLEADGQVVLELKGQPCLQESVEKTTPQDCIDLAVDDEHANHEPAPTKVPPHPEPVLLPVLALLPLPPPPVLTGRESPPLFATHPIVLRATTVLLI